MLKTQYLAQSMDPIEYEELKNIFLLNNKGKRFENVSAELKIFQKKQLAVEDPLTATVIRKIVETYAIANLDAQQQKHIAK